MFQHLNVTQKMMKRALAVSTIAFAFTSVEIAAAAPNFPDAVQEVFGTSCVPSCLLCHSTNPGRKGTAFPPVGTPFGTAVVQRGIPGQVSDDAIKAALIQLRDGAPTGTPPLAAPSDSDGDLMTDAAELAADINPNPGNAELCEVTYGCGARVAPAAPNRRFAIFSSVAVALGLIGLTLRARSKR